MLALKPQKRLQLLRKRDRYMFFLRFLCVFFLFFFWKKHICISSLQGGMAGMCYFVPYCNKTRESSRYAISDLVSMILTRSHCHVWCFSAISLEFSIWLKKSFWYVGRSLCEVWRDAIVASLLTGWFLFCKLMLSLRSSDPMSDVKSVKSWVNLSAFWTKLSYNSVFLCSQHLDIILILDIICP